MGNLLWHQNFLSKLTLQLLRNTSWVRKHRKLTQKIPQVERSFLLSRVTQLEMLILSKWIYLSWNSTFCLQKMLHLRCCSVRVLCPCWNCFSIDQRNHKVTIKANQSKGNYDEEPIKTRYKNMQLAKARENARMISPLHLTGWENGARFLNQSRSDAR